MKDEACNHIRCDKCTTEWCYFCGKTKEELLGKGDKNFYDHLSNWPDKEANCPMMLDQICERDARWPEGAKECLNFFHRKLAIASLRVYLNTISVKKFEVLILKCLFL